MPGLNSFWDCFSSPSFLCSTCSLCFLSDVPAWVELVDDFSTIHRLRLADARGDFGEHCALVALGAAGFAAGADLRRGAIGRVPGREARLSRRGRLAALA